MLLSVQPRLLLLLLLPAYPYRPGCPPGPRPRCRAAEPKLVPPSHKRVARVPRLHRRRCSRLSVQTVRRRPEARGAGDAGVRHGPAPLPAVVLPHRRCSSRRRCRRRLRSRVNSVPARLPHPAAPAVYPRDQQAVRTGRQRPSRAGRGRPTSRGGKDRGHQRLALRRRFVLRAPSTAAARAAAGAPGCLWEAGGAGIHSLYAEKPDRLYQAAL